MVILNKQLGYLKQYSKMKNRITSRHDLSHFKLLFVRFCIVIITSVITEL